MNAGVVRAVSVLVLSASLAAPPALASVDRLSFDVYLDDDPIGSHEFRFDHADGAKRVEIEATFDVKVLFIPVYSYRHSNTEVWRQGCLQRIQSRTDANGTLYAVSGEGLDDVFRIEAGPASQTVDVSCLMTFAYWDRGILAQQRLLNAQTGEVVDVDVETLGRSTLRLRGRDTVVEGYRITAPAEGVDISVFYAPDGGAWLALESRLQNGRVMRYEPSADHLLVSAQGQEQPR